MVIVFVLQHGEEHLFPTPRHKDMMALAMLGYVVDVYETAGGGFSGCATIAGKYALLESCHNELMKR